MLATGAVVITDSPTPASATVVDENTGRSQIFSDTNAARAANGLAPLVINTGLNNVAQAWAKQMSADNKMYHNVNYSKQIPAGWSRAGENVAYGYTHITVTPAWMASPGHKANILGDYTDIGIGYFVDAKGVAWEVQNFGKYATGPKAPTNVTAANPRAAGTTMTFDLSWTAPPATSDPISYYVVTATNNVTGAVVFNKTVKTTSIPVTGLAVNVQHKVSIIAYSVSGKGSPAATLNYTITQKPVAPQKVSIVSSSVVLVAANNNTATVTWKTVDVSPNLPTQYVVTSTDSVTKKSVSTTVTATVATSYSHQIKNLPAGATVTVTVTAKNSAGSSPAVSLALKTKAVPKAPATPTVKNVSSAKLQISWKAPSSELTVSSYNVVITNSKGATVKTLKVAGTTTTVTLVKNSSYRVKIQAVSAAGASAYSALSATVKIVK